MASAVIKLSVILLLVAVLAVDISEQQGSPLEKPVTEACLSCICHAVSGCNVFTQCEGVACGPFQITSAYWGDTDRPTVHGQSPDDPDAYENCTKDSHCAALTVQGYMKKYAQDCNGDGRVDCYDFMAIHRTGGYGCTAELPTDYVEGFNQCVSVVGGV